MIDTLKGYDVDKIDAEYNKQYQDAVKNIGSNIEDVNAHLYK